MTESNSESRPTRARESGSGSTTDARQQRVERRPGERRGLERELDELPAEDSVFDHFDTPIAMMKLEPGAHDIHVYAANIEYGFTSTSPTS